jgi:hypothetical protein
LVEVFFSNDKRNMCLNLEEDALDDFVTWSNGCFLVTNVGEIDVNFTGVTMINSVSTDIQATLHSDARLVVKNESKTERNFDFDTSWNQNRFTWFEN